MPAPDSPALRPVERGDVAQINALLTKVWFPQRSPAGFNWLFEHNPGQSGLVPGWVALDADGRVCAFLGNFVQQAWRNGERHLLASGHSFVAREGQGGRGLSLLRTFLRQREPALLSGMNANSVSARIYEAMRLTAYPETGATKLNWMTQPAIAAAGAISWRLHKLSGERFIRRIPDLPRPKPDIPALLARHDGDIAYITAPATHAGLDAFDKSLRAGRRLFTERSPAALQWRLSDPDADFPPVLIAHPATGALRGLALLQFNKPSEAEPPYLDLIDLVTLDPDDRPSADALMKCALSIARGGGAARLRLSVVTPELLALLGTHRDTAIKATSDKPYAFFKAHANAEQPLTGYWHPLPYDGDNGPSLRPLPIRKK